MQHWRTTDESAKVDGMNRTWMKVTEPQGSVFYVGIEEDAIVEYWIKGHVTPALIRRRADDTLSVWARQGSTIEGPFDEPE